ncbi:MAG: hypothetical protein IPK76_23250 [Lewinellaceae bacterium]|nr:hypothetical protein [Lewinellaceae bacterium]
MDAYNANPSSMAMALRSLDRTKGASRMAILGDMYELGADSAAEHQAVVDLLVTMPTVEPVLVGAAFCATSSGSLAFFSSAWRSGRLAGPAQSRPHDHPRQGSRG